MNRQSRHIGSGGYGHLPPLNGTCQFRRAIVQNNAGTLIATPTDVPKIGGLCLGACANWRMLIITTLKVGDLSRHHFPLARVQVAPVDIEAHDAGQSNLIRRDVRIAKRG